MAPLGSGVIANAVIEVTVDRSRLKSGVDATRRDVQKAAVDISNDSEKVGRSVKKQIGEFTGAVARAGAVIGTFYAFVELGEKIRYRFESAALHARDFFDTLTSPSAVERAKQIQEELTRLSGEYSGYFYDARSRLQGILTGNTPARLKEQMDSMQAMLKAANKAANAEAQKAEKEKNEQAVKAVKDRISAVARTGATGQEEIILRYQDQVQQTYEIEKKARTEEEKAAAVQLRQLLISKQNGELAQLNIQQQIESMEQRRKIAQEWADIERKGREEIEEQNRLLNEQKNAVKQASIDATGRLVTSIDNLNQVVLRIEQGMRGLK